MTFRFPRQRIFPLSLGLAVVVLGALVCRQLVEAAWAPPTTAAPGGNVAPVLNTSGTSQTKQGSLTLGSSLTLPNENLLFQAPTKGIYWGTGVNSEAHVDYSDGNKRLYLSAGQLSGGIELQGNVYITPFGAYPETGRLTIKYFESIGGCQNNKTVKTLDTGELTCADDNQGAGGGTIDGSGDADKVAVFQDDNTLTFDDAFHWDRSNQRLGLGTNNPQATLDVNGDVRLDSLRGCDTLDTDALGTLRCGTDETGGVSLWENGGTPNTINPTTPGNTRVAIGHNTIADATQLSVKNNSINSAIYAEQSNANGSAGYFSGRLTVSNGNVGIGDTTPASSLTVGNNDTFQVDSAGDVIRIRNITYSWTVSQGAFNTLLRNDGAGNLTWVAGPGGISGSGNPTEVAYWTGNTSVGSNANLFWDNTNSRLGIGDTTPAAPLTVGNNDTFQVNSAGDIARIQNVAYSWPNAQGGAGTFLKNDGTGNLSWSTGGSDANTLKVTANDTTPNFLSQKLIGGANITLTVQNPGGNEKLKIDSSGAGGPPVGSSGQTLRHDNTTWLATSNLYNNGSSVSVGQTSPVGRFVINNNTSQTGSAGDAVATYANTVGSAIYAQQNNSSGYAGYFSGKTVVTSGNFGIGTSSPDQKFTQVGGNMVHRYDTNDWIEPLPALNLGGPETFGLEISGQYMLITQGSRGIRFIDISKPAAPVLINTYSQAGWGYYTIKVAGRYAYVRAYKSSFPQRAELDIFDISNPYNITLVGTLLNLEPFRMDIAGKYLYTTENYGLNPPYTSRLKIIDISNPAAPVQAGQSAILTERIEDIEIAGRYAYLSATDAGVRIFDISNAANPLLISTTQLMTVFGYPGSAWGSALSGRYLYVGGNLSDALYVLDVKNPNAPQVIYNADQGEDIEHVFVSGKYLYCQKGNQFIYIYDIRNPGAPIRLIGGGDWGWIPTQVYVYGGYVYVADYSGYLQIIEIPHLETPSITTGSIETSQAHVNDNLTIGSSLYVRSAVQVGSRGIKSDGLIQGGDLAFWNRYSFTELGESGIGLASPSNDMIASFESNGNITFGAPRLTSRRLTVSGDLLASGLWELTQTGDQKDRQPLSDGLSKILSLSGQRADGVSSSSYQLDINSLADVLPELVQKNGEITEVSETELVPILITALQEQQKQIDELELQTNLIPSLAL